MFYLHDVYLIIITLFSRPGMGNRIQNSLKALRCLQLYVGQLNIVNQNLIFTWKLLCLFMSIVCGYAAIAHFKDYTIFGVMYYALFLDASLIYTLLYEKALRVPALFKESKVQLRFCAKRIKVRAERDLLERQALSVPPVGIKVGSFHVLERTSTPVFVNFVLNNVVSMLVVYK